MKTKITNFLFNGLTYGIVFFALSFLIGYYSFSLPVRNVLPMSVAIGGLGLIVNGLIQSRFTKSSKMLDTITISLQHFEAIKMAAPANHVIDDHLVSGKLFLTEQRLVFKSFEQEEYSWSLRQLNGFKFHPSIFNRGGEFIVVHREERKLVFEVDEISAWKKALMNLE